MHPRLLVPCIGMLLFITISASFAQTAEFTADVKQGCFPLTVHFNDASTGASGWHWDFGNGNTADIQNPSATYSAPGKYDVTLTVSDGSHFNSLTHTGFIIVHDYPTVDFSFDVNTGCAPLSIKFRDNTSSSTGQITSWEWVFNDGGSSDRANPTYTFNQPGNRNVSLRVKNEFGCESFKTSTSPIIVLGPTVAFDIDKSFDCLTPAKFQFTNKSTGDGLSHQWSFGDGATDSSKDPSHTYTKAGTFTITLKTKDKNGCEQSTQKTVTVGNEGGLDFTATPEKVCLGKPVEFSLVSTDAPINAVWDFGNGKKAFRNDTTYIYPAAGTYTVRLTSLLLNHTCASTVTKTIIVAPPAQPSFESKIDCKYNVTLSSTSTNTTRVEWYIDDVFASGANSFVSPVHSSGTQEVRLLAYDVAGCSVEQVQTVSVPQNPEADFTPGIQQSCDKPSLSGCAPFTVNFASITTSQDPITIQWDFGTGQTSNASTANVTYTKKGLFQVTMTATNSRGCSDTETKFVIVADQAPVPDFDIDKKEACAGEDVTFTAKQEGADFWCWDFGDGKLVSNNSNVTIHKFPKPGTFDVTLTAKNAGCIATATKKKIIRIKDPLVDYNILRSCEDPYTINLVNKSANYHRMHWEFGDGQTSTDINVGSHTYAAEGNYVLTLVGENDTSRCITRAFTNLSIEEVKADFVVNPAKPCKGSPINFQDNSHAASKYKWTIAGTSFTVPEPTLKIKTAGTYNASLEVTDSNGCQASKNVNFDVIDLEGDFSYTAVSNCNEFAVTFNSISKGSLEPTGWSWDFGEGGSPVTTRNAVHTYHTPGKYTVALTMTALNGSCTFAREDAVNFTVPVPSFETAKSTFCPGETVIAANTTKNAGTYEWDFGDSRRSDAISPTIVYNNTGSYNITLFARDQYGCERKLEKVNVVTIKKPVAGFSVAASSSDCPPFTASFSDHSKDDIQKWDWDFGDKNKSSIKDPANVYLTPGAFDVTLTVTDKNGCTDTKTANQFVNIGGPYGSFIADEINSCTNDGVTFRATTTNATTLRWDFGDGIVVDNNSRELLHLYTKSGAVTPNLLLIDMNGCKTVAKGPGQLIIKDTTLVSATTTPVCIHTEEPFILKGKNDSDNEQLSWKWDVDDVYVGDGETVEATVTEPGLKIVHGRATNKYGCVSNTVDSVRVQGPIKMIPNVITPNNDVSNETFRIIGLENSIWNIEIVNRWGNVVYRRKGYEGEWDAADQPAGVYYYILRNAICDDVTYKGYLSVAK